MKPAGRFPGKPKTKSETHKMGIKDIAARIGQARANGGGNYLKDGRGIGIVKALKQENLHKGETFIAELLIESSEASGEVNPDGTSVGPPNPPGSTVSMIQQFEEFPETAFNNTKTFIYALMGETDESMAAAAIETQKAMAKAGKPKAEIDAWDAAEEFAAAYTRLTSAENPARGMRIRFETFRKMTKTTRKMLTLPRWETVQQTVEEIQSNRQKLG